MKMLKRGLSSLVVVVILILVAISAISIIWTFSREAVIGSAEDVNKQISSFTGSFSILEASVNQTNDEFYFIVRRNSGGSDFNVTGIKIIIEDAVGNVEYKTFYAIFNELETKAFFGKSYLPGNLTKLSIAPIIVLRSDEIVLNIADFYIFSGNERDLSKTFVAGGGGGSGGGIQLIVNDEDGLPFHLLYQCANNVDDDGDGFLDYPQDPECQYANQTKENAPYLGRPLYTTRDQYVSVCPTCQYKKIQEVVNNIPIFVLHQYYIVLSPGIYNENVRVPMYFGNQITNLTSEERVPARVAGNFNNLYEVNVSSFIVGSVSGVQPFQIGALTVTNNTPYGQARAGIEIYNSGEISVDYVSFGKNVENGILCSSSRCFADWIRFLPGSNAKAAFVSEKNSTFSSWMEFGISGAPRSIIPGFLHNASDSLIIHDSLATSGLPPLYLNESYNLTALSGNYTLKNSLFSDDEANRGYGFSDLASATNFLQNHIVNDKSRFYLIENIDDYLKPYIDSGNLTLPSNTVGGTRPLVSSGTVNVNVCSSGCNYSLIQNALNKIPLILKHNMTIQIKNGIYNEDLVMPIFMGYGSKVTLIGNSSNPNSTVIGSLYVDNARGPDPLLLEGFKTTRNSSYGDEDTTLWLQGVSNATLKNLILTNKNPAEPSGEGLLCYSSLCHLYNISFGYKETWSAVHNKHSSIIIEHLPSFGEVGGRGYTGGHGFMLIRTNTSQLNVTNLVNYPSNYYSDNKGFSIDVERGLSYGISF